MNTTPGESAGTLSCLTDAIARREGPHSVGSSPPAAPRIAVKPEELPEPELPRHAPRVPPWRSVAAFAVGAASAAFAGIAFEAGAIALAVLASTLGGTLILATAIAGLERETQRQRMREERRVRRRGQ